MTQISATPILHAPASVLGAQSPLDPIVHKAGAALAALRMTRIGQWHADEEDAKSLLDDLDAIVAIIDPIILAIGEYAGQHFSRIDLSLFSHQLRDALDGNATYEIASAAEAIVQERMDEAA